ncbi:MAG TPA: hypothetical protein VL737_00745 [Candidatus Pristimantibacillus sp.]|jgi:hypothetical protein|nr:hypothetical protein [Candidatus Pristimantibacillus sp.]
MAIEVFGFERALPANGPDSWAEYFGQAWADGQRWYQVKPGAHVLRTSNLPFVGQLIAMSDGRGKYSPYANLMDVPVADRSVPLVAEMRPVTLGPDFPTETTLMPLYAFPRGIISFPDVCLAGLARWVPGYPSN